MGCLRLKVWVPQNESGVRNYDRRRFDGSVLSQYREDANSGGENYL